MSVRVLIVHDFLEVLEGAASALQQAGFRVFTNTDPLAAVDTINRYAPDVLVTRLNFGAERLKGGVLARVAGLRRNGTAVLFLAHAEWESREAGGGECLMAPLDTQMLIAAIRRVVSAGGTPEASGPQVLSRAPERSPLRNSS